MGDRSRATYNLCITIIILCFHSVMICPIFVAYDEMIPMLKPMVCQVLYLLHKIKDFTKFTSPAA